MTKFAHKNTTRGKGWALGSQEEKDEKRTIKNTLGKEEGTGQTSGTGSEKNKNTPRGKGVGTGQPSSTRKEHKDHQGKMGGHWQAE